MRYINASGIFIILLYSCTSSKTQIFSFKDSSDIHLKKNQKFIIELPTTMGTGYRWHITDSAYKSCLQLDSIKVISDQKVDDGKDIQQFYFKSIKSGKCVLFFIRKRPWEGNEKKDKEKLFQVYIQ